MLDQADQENAHAQALRDADYASLTRRAATDSSDALVDEVLRLIATVEARERQRGAKATAAFRQAVERFVGDLLVALAKAQHNDGDVAVTEHGNSVGGWVVARITVTFASLTAATIHPSSGTSGAVFTAWETKATKD
jgi:hypothetical protein